MFTLSQFDTFLFAFDGVLVDSIECVISAYGELYADHGDEVRGMVEAYQRAHPGEARADRIRMFHRTLLGEELTQAQIAAECDRLGEIIIDEIADCPLMPDVTETLDVLKAYGIAAHIISSLPQDELKTIATRKKLAPHLRSMHGTPRSREMICEEIFALNGADRTRYLFVGNSMMDYRCAASCGTHFVGIGDFATSPFPFGTQVVQRLGEVFLEIATARLGRPVTTTRPIELGRRFRTV